MDGFARAEQRAARALARAVRVTAWVESVGAPALRRLRTWIDRARQRRTLETVDDWILKDIGISRADAMQEHDKPFWQP